MGQRINRLGRGTSYHGNAGIASAFVALADKKLKPGGVLALVLPLSIAAGLSWQDCRRMLADNYSDFTVLSIAANGPVTSFSSDTGMAECLVIARKNAIAEPDASPPRAQFASLLHRPGGFAQTAVLAKAVIAPDSIRAIEDGPVEGTRLQVGGDITGEMGIAPLDRNGAIWGSVRVSDYSVAQTAYYLSQAQLWLPRQFPAQPLPIVPLNSVGKLGLVHRDITGPAPRGPFNKASPTPSALYPALWNHNASKETRLVCEPDSALRVRTGMDDKARAVWQSASRAHLNLDFRLNSQPLAATHTEQESIGGRAWPNVKFEDTRFDYPFTLWGNSTLGLLMFWWHANRQQDGRGIITIRSAETLPVLDFGALTDAQLTTAAAIFDEFRALELQPAYLADADPNRALLDRRVICDLLGFDEDIYRAVRLVAAKWCAEPSVHGGKRRPRGAGPVV